jgi:hypothetical protein
MAYNPIDNTVHTGAILEAAHWPGSTAHFSEGSLDGIGSMNLASVFYGAIKEVEQFFQVLRQAMYSFWLNQ